jgi:D-apionolactonase
MSEFSLRAGPLSILYQDGFLRYISLGENEILRMIYFALRDENWGTYSCHIEKEKLDIQKDHFTIQYDCYHELAGKRIYHWRASIVGDQSGIITFDLNGVAMEAILKNRAGFCILHPIKGVAGEPCETLHPDRIWQANIFPKLISPTDPFKNVNGMRWKSHNATWLLKFEGELFETEDQRNWTDASYKTFCTPLDQPFPMQLQKGDTVFQKITFSPEAPIPYQENSSAIISITKTGDTIKLPSIGIGASTETDHLTGKAIDAIRELSLSHYRIEVAPYEATWISRFKTDCDNATKLQLSLEIALTLTSDFINEINQFITAAVDFKGSMKSIILLSRDSLTTDQQLINYATTIKAKWPDVKIGAGTNYNFTELNRNRFDATSLDFISFSIDPQEHATDDRTLIENLEGQSEVVKSAIHMYPGKLIQVSPLTLRRRYNPYATNAKARISSENEKSDPRQTTSFASLFTLGSLKALAQAPVDSLTLFQTVGNQGIFSSEGDPYPVYTILKEILAKPYQMIVTKSSNALKSEVILLDWQQRRKQIMVNYTNENQKVIFDNQSFELPPGVVFINVV